ncbi:MAG TPA: hypothetical protein VIH05_02340 [Tepidiformaceae bacterium]
MSAEPRKSEALEQLHEVASELPEEHVREVIDFARALKAATRKDTGPYRRLYSKTTPGLYAVLVPGSSLGPFKGIIGLGGDALEDSEALYDE